MLLAIYFLVIILAIIYPKSKTVTASICVVMFVIYGLNTYSGDSAAYEYVYGSFSRFGFSHYEPGFSLVMCICYLLRLPFIGFRCALAALFVTILYKALLKYTENTAIVLAMFCICPFLYYVSVLRAGIAAAIVLWSVSYLYENTNKAKIKFVISLVFAVSFHYTSVFFFLFLLANKNVAGKTFLKVFVCACVVAVIIRNIDILFRVASSFFSRAKTLQWLSSKANTHLNIKGILAQIIILSVNIVATYICYRKFESVEESEGQYRYAKWLATITFNFNLWMVILIPYMTMNDVAMRFIYVIFPLNSAVVLNTAQLIRERNSDVKIGRSLHNISYIGAFGVAWCFIVLFYMSMPYIGTVNSPWLLFKNNLLNVFG